MEKSSWFIEKSEFYTDGTRLDHTTRKWIPIRDKDDRELPDADRYQAVWDKNSWYSYHEAEKVSESSVFITRSDEMKKQYLPIAYPGGPLEGFFPGDLKTVSSIFHEASQVRLYDEKENINGIPCYVLETTTEYGTHKIWLDTEHGYNICQAEVIRNKEDLYNNDPLYRPYPDWSKIEVKQREGKPPLLKSPRVKTVFKLWNVKFKEFNGRFY